MHIPNERSRNRCDVGMLLLIKAKGSRCQVAKTIQQVSIVITNETAKTLKQLFRHLNIVDECTVRIEYRIISINTLNGTSKILKTTFKKNALNAINGTSKRPKTTM